MKIAGLHHYTLRCDAGQLESLRDFYAGVLGLVVGRRPDLRFSGYWLYAGDRPVVHLYASGAPEADQPNALDHVAFEASGLVAVRARLDALGIAYSEAPVPGFEMHQLFVHDPTGLKLELNFDLSREQAA